MLDVFGNELNIGDICIVSYESGDLEKVKLEKWGKKSFGRETAIFEGYWKGLTSGKIMKLI